MAYAAWWRGSRGEWYVVVQMVLFVLVAVGPANWHDWPAWPFPQHVLLAALGWILLTGGGLLAAAGAIQVGAKLTALPFPAAGGVLRETGAFRCVRHPMYCGAIIAALGWAIVRHGWLTLAFAVALFILFDLKTRREELWLRERFTGYAAYQRRVRKLVPFVY